MKLFYKKYGEGQPMIIVHGLFGMLDNWQTLGKKFAENFEVFLIDQRNHGHSPHSDIMNYQAMADDLHEFILDHNLSDVILLGHSMGGKTVMTYATEHPEFIDKLIVVDIAPKQYPMHHQQILAGLNSIDLGKIKNRREADEQLKKYIDNVSIRQFLLKNLYWIEKGKLAWRFNLPVIERNMNDILAATPQIRVETPTLFIRGEKSGYITEDDYQDIYNQFVNSEIETIYGVGHWVHAENPLEFYNLVMEFCAE